MISINLNLLFMMMYDDAFTEVSLFLFLKFFRETFNFIICFFLCKTLIFNCRLIPSPAYHDLNKLSSTLSDDASTQVLNVLPQWCLRRF